jgi:hypothetical protein
MQSGQARVPKGQATIAQRLSVGKRMREGVSPEGTAEACDLIRQISRPSGTYRWGGCPHPTLKR